MARTVRPITIPIEPGVSGVRPGRRRGLAVFAALILVAAIVRLLGSGQLAWLSNLLLIFSALLLQTFPFVLLGALVSAAIEVFATASVFARLVAIPRAFRLPAAGFAGLAFPVCECGSVPVARRLAVKGLQSSAAVTFMLAASIFNPIVILSTAIAYRDRGNMLLMVLGRASLGLAVAIIAGWIIGDRTKKMFLRNAEPDHHTDDRPGRSPRAEFFVHFAADALFMGRYLVLGAFGAALFQTFVPQSVIGSVSSTPVLDLVVMMALAGVLSLCSESDAFVAASFVQFGPAAQLAFLVFGPLFNMKLGALYAGTFSKGFVRTIFVIVASATLAGTLWIEAFVR